MIANNPLIFSCTIPGKPQPWKRTRGNAGRRFTDPRWQSYSVAACWEMALALRRDGLVRPLFPEGPVWLELVAVWPCGRRPKGVQGRRWKATRPDGDNVLKGIADASQGFLVADDGQYARQGVRCFYGSPHELPHVQIWAASLDCEPPDGTFPDSEAP